MNDKMNIFSKLTHAAVITLLVSVMPVSAEEAAGQSGSGTAAILDMEGVVDNVDMQARELSVGSGLGLKFTLFVPASVDMATISLGDRVTGTYFSAVEIDLQKPGDKELADPWQVLQEGSVTGGDDEVGIDKARRVRAVVTILALDKDKGVIVVMDSRDMMHFIANVEPEKLATLTTNQKVVVEFTEAMAVTLEKKS